MKILFINTNQIVQKLVEVTAQKANVELITVSEPSQIGDMEQYDYIIADDGCYNMDKSAYDTLISGRRACLIYSKHEEMSEGFSEYIKKPFIPTHILEIMLAQIANAQNKEAFFQTTEFTESNPSPDISDESPQSDEHLSPLSHLKALSEAYHLDNEESSLEDTGNAQPLPTELGKEDILGDLKLEEGLEDLNLTESSDMDMSEDLLDSLTAQSPQAPEGAPQELAQTDEGQDIDLEALDLGEFGDVETEESALDNDERLESESEIAQQVEEAREGADVEENAESGAEDRAAPQVLDSEQINEVSHILDELQEKEETKDKSDEASAQQGSEVDLMGDINLDELGDLSGFDELDKSDEAKESAQEDSDTTQESAESSASPDELAQGLNLDLGMQDLDLESLDLEDLHSEDMEGLEDTHESSESLKEEEMSLDETGEEGISSNEQSEIQSGGAQDSKNEELQALESDELESSEIESNEPQAHENTTIESTQSPQDTESSEDAQAEQSLESPKEKPQDTKEVEDSHIEIEEVRLDEDFQALDEREVLRAVGEEAAPIESTPQTNAQENLNALDTADIALDTAKSEETDASKTNKDIAVVTNALSQSIQDSIKHLQSSELTALLDGMEVTINISFKDTNK